MKVKEIMSRTLEWIPADATVQDAARKMRDLNVGSLPVREPRLDGGLAGIITDRDITCRCVAGGDDPAKTSVAVVMSKAVVSCDEDDDVTEAARLMGSSQVHRLVVCDRRQHLIGMLSLADIATHGPYELSGEVVAAISQRVTRPLFV